MAYPARSAYPSLTVTHSEEGASTDPIFIAPYNAPSLQAGAVIVDYSGRADLGEPARGQGDTNFQVQRYRGSPVLTWWEGRSNSATASANT